MSSVVWVEDRWQCSRKWPCCCVGMDPGVWGWLWDWLKWYAYSGEERGLVSVLDWLRWHEVRDATRTARNVLESCCYYRRSCPCVASLLNNGHKMARWPLRLYTFCDIICALNHQRIDNKKFQSHGRLCACWSDSSSKRGLYDESGPQTEMIVRRATRYQVPITFICI
jgi:hypothetical protein